MKIKELLEALSDYSPFLFFGSNEAEVASLVEDYQSDYVSEGVHVLNSLSAKGCKCAPTIITCNAFAGLLPPTAFNVILVDVQYLDAVHNKLTGMLP